MKERAPFNARDSIITTCHDWVSWQRRLPPVTIIVQFETIFAFSVVLMPRWVMRLAFTSATRSHANVHCIVDGFIIPSLQTSNPNDLYSICIYTWTQVDTHTHIYHCRLSRLVVWTNTMTTLWNGAPSLEANPSRSRVAFRLRFFKLLLYNYIATPLILLLYILASGDFLVHPGSRWLLLALNEYSRELKVIFYSWKKKNQWKIQENSN